MDAPEPDLSILEPSDILEPTSTLDPSTLIEPSTYCTPSYRQQRKDSERKENEFVELCDGFTPSHKMDTLTSKKINRLITFTLIVIVFTFAHVIALSTLCNTLWYGKKMVLGMFGKKLVVATCSPSIVYMKVLLVFDIICSISLLILAVSFTVRIIRTKMLRNPQQIWAVLLVVAGALSYNPIISILTLKDSILKGSYGIGSSPFVKFNRAFILFLSSKGQLFYLWTTSHHYGILDESDRPTPLRFYAPKVLTITLVSAGRVLLSLNMRVTSSPIPLSTVAAMAANWRAIGQCPLDLTLKIGILTFFELFVFGAILRCLYTTAGVLKKAHYLKFRSKQVGFRFFCMQNFIVYLLFIIADATIILSVPRYWEVKHLLSFPYQYFLFNDRFSAVPKLLDYVIICITAYVNLPADSVGFMGWFKATTWEEESEQPEKIGLKIFDNECKFNLQQMSTRMIYQLHVELFNASDLACISNSPKHAMVVAGQDFIRSSGYVKELEIFNEKSETYVVILGCVDRIVIAFKGASSVGNMKADMNLGMVRIADVIPSNKSSTHSILTTIYWKKTCIHSGFATAYASICTEILAKITQLREAKERPVFFTGHSLGGALASLCCLDVVLSLNISDVCVATFGSPRCGNIFWSKIYDQMVCAHWRVEVRSDLITTLPGKEYKHVGKRAVLYKTGELFLDPNAIEVLFWPSGGVNLADHRKPVYKEALAALSSKYLPAFKPTFIIGGSS